MRKTTLVKADRELVKATRELGANVKRIVDLALEDYINRNLVLKPEIEARKRSSGDCDGGVVEENNPSKEHTFDWAGSLAWITKKRPERTRASGACGTGSNPVRPVTRRVGP